MNEYIVIDKNTWTIAGSIWANDIKSAKLLAENIYFTDVALIRANVDTQLD